MCLCYCTFPAHYEKMGMAIRNNGWLERENIWIRLFKVARAAFPTISIQKMTKVFDLIELKLMKNTSRRNRNSVLQIFSLYSFCFAYFFPSWWKRRKPVKRTTSGKVKNKEFGRRSKKGKRERFSAIRKHWKNKNTKLILKIKIQ